MTRLETMRAMGHIKTAYKSLAAAEELIKSDSDVRAFLRLEDALMAVKAAMDQMPKVVDNGS
jgi:hypothetical protein